MTARIPLCLIEDDTIMGESLVERLHLEGYEVCWCQNAAEALETITARDFAAIVSDIRLPDMSGEALFRCLSERMNPLPPTLFITAYGSIDQAVTLLRMGARDYLTKPLDIAGFLAKLRDLCDAGDGVQGQHAVLGISPAARKIEATLERLVRYPNAVVLLRGETGVGKEVVARLLHQWQCPNEAFVALNCAALPEALAASELFGHEKGGFTGAISRHAGVFERAGEGILFLDEVGDMPLELQIQLLRVLQERSFRAIGGESERQFRARLVCATHRDLSRLVDEGAFREDLYYRLNVVEIAIPPLRERPEDIPWLAERLLREICETHGEAPRRFSAAAKEAMLARSWPGNVRELKHCIERACILGECDELTPGILDIAPREAGSGNPLGDLKSGLEADEKQRLRAALTANDHRIKITAEALGISRKALWQKMKKHGLDRRGKTG